MIKLLAVLLLTFTVQAQTIQDSIEKLRHDDYDIREQGTLELSKLPAEYAFILLKLSESFTDPEVSERLHQAHKTIFINSVLPQYTDWKWLIGSLGFDFTLENVYSPEESGMYTLLEQQLIVRWVYEGTSGYGLLKDGDVIYQIDGKGVREFTDQRMWDGWRFLQGEELVLKFRRFKSGYANDGEEFTEHEVKIIVGTKDLNTIHTRDILRVQESCYRDFLDRYKKFSEGS